MALPRLRQSRLLKTMVLHEGAGGVPLAINNKYARLSSCTSRMYSEPIFFFKKMAKGLLSFAREFSCSEILMEY